MLPSILADVNPNQLVRSTKGFFRKTSLDKAQLSLRRFERQRKRRENKNKLLVLQQKENEREIVQIEKAKKEIEDYLKTENVKKLPV